MVEPMSPMTYQQLRTNWKINHLNNLNLLDFLEKVTTEDNDDRINQPIRPRGRTVQTMLEHLVKNKFDWLQHLKPSLDDYQVPTADTPLRKQEVIAFNWVDKLIQLQAAGTKVSGFKSDLFGFVIYLISHDSHHRGQIMQTLKTNGILVPKSIQYGIWEW